MNRPLIPKGPVVPELTSEQIEALTDIVFLPKVELVPSDVIFVFGGTHPGHWHTAIDAFRRELGKTIIVTGGVSPTAVRHPDWPNATTPESHVIVDHLLTAGIPPHAIVQEDRSRNTLENVLFAKEVFDFRKVDSVLFICKSHCAGRQYRTLAKHLPSHTRFLPFGFETEYGEDRIHRENWMKSPKGRARVYGEYLRICFYGTKGDLLPMDQPVLGLS